MGNSRLDELIRKELAELVSRNLEFPEGLITVLYVTCASNQKFMAVGVSVLPDHLAGSGLRALRRKSEFFAKRVQERCRLRNIPKIQWVFDPTEKEAAKIDALINKIVEEEG